MKSSAKNASKAEAHRMSRVKQMRCVACSLRKQMLFQPSPTEVHHLLSGNKRRGHLYTIPLCGWHHRGIQDATLEMEYWHGPSLALTSKKFHETYGSDDALLALTNKQLENHDACRT